MRVTTFPIGLIVIFILFALSAMLAMFILRPRSSAAPRPTSSGRGWWLLVFLVVGAVVLGYLTLDVSEMSSGANEQEAVTATATPPPITRVAVVKRTEEIKGETATSSLDGSSETASAPPSPPVRYTVAAPDDFAVWLKYDNLDFRPWHYGRERHRFRNGRSSTSDGSTGEAEWWKLEANGPGRVSQVVGDTEFQVWLPNEQNQLAGFSSAEATETEAIVAAQRAAQDKLAALALKKVKQRAHGKREELDSASAYELARQLAGQENFYREVDARYERARIRGRESVYRVAVLVEADDQRVDRLATEIRREIERGWFAEREKVVNWLWTGASMIVLAFAIFLLYTFLNAGTKGHFAWPLRFVSAILFVFLCLAIYYVSRHYGIST